MAIRDIMIFPHPCLRKVAAEVQNIDDEIQTLVDDMLETMYDAEGVGLAATQINVIKRVVVMDCSEAGDSPIVAINPMIVTASSETAERSEGCLSIPGVHDNVTRPAQVTFRALDRSGESYEMAAEGLLAACIQHEIDHLDGKLFIDGLSSLKRDRIRKKMEKLKRD
ncbi:MAG: peptide deformylase [Gammaproteobacteria bacterium]|nr:peptide deformylase [Gammaproteobacteria bacterium]